MKERAPRPSYVLGSTALGNIIFVFSVASLLLRVLTLLQSHVDFMVSWMFITLNIFNDIVIVALYPFFSYTRMLYFKIKYQIK